MITVHVTSSTSLGSIERQILGLARSLPEGHRSVFLSFREGGRCQAFLDTARELGYPAQALEHDTPRLVGAMAELRGSCGRSGPTSSAPTATRPTWIGLAAVRRAGISIVAVSHGWTRESRRVRRYEALDRVVLRKMDRVGLGLARSGSQGSKGGCVAPADRRDPLRGRGRTLRGTRPGIS